MFEESGWGGVLVSKAFAREAWIPYCRSQLPCEGLCGPVVPAPGRLADKDLGRAGCQCS